MKDLIPTNNLDDSLNSFAGKKVIITGAAGFIGTNLTKELLKAGATVIGIDNFISSSGKNLGINEGTEGFTFIKADVIQPPKSYLPEEDWQFDYLFHFASPASPPIYQKYPVETYLVNSLGTHNLLSFLRQYSPEATFVYAGTSEAYGNPLEHPQKETYWGNVNPNGVRSCYDESKRLGETIGGVFNRDFGIDVRILRIFNTYGPYMNLEDGRVLPEFIKQYQAGKELVVFGDGSQTRSYCYIDDLVRGILLLAGGKKSELSGETINLGNPGEYTVLETARIFNRIVGRDEEMIAFEELPSDDPLKRQPDISKARGLLGWEPEVEFEDGLKRMLEFFKG